MKACWDNLNRITKHTRKFGIFYIKTTQYVLRDSCKNCGDEYLAKRRGRKISAFCSLKCSQSGEFHPCYGKKPSLKAIQKMSKTRKRGMYVGENNPMYGMRGPKSPNWKGGKDQRKAYRKVYEFTEWRKSVFGRDDYTCQMCGLRGGDKEAHHVYPVSLFPEYVYDIWNGATLCKGCHYKIKSNELKYISYFLTKAINPALSEVKYGQVG